MTIVFADGAEAKVGAGPWSTFPRLTTSTVRTGLQAFYATGVFQPPINDNSTIVLGFGVNPKASGRGPLARIAGETDHLEVGFVGSTLNVTLNGSTTIDQMPLSVLPLQAWSYIEIRWTPGASGSVQLRINGETPSGWTDFTGAAGTANTGAQFYNVTLDGQGWWHIYDDMYVEDSATFLGPQTIGTMAPTADVISNWTGSDGNNVDNFQLINDFTMTNFVETTTPGHIQLCETADPALSGVPMAVVATALARDAAGSGGQIKIGVDLGGARSSTTHALDVTAKAVTHIAETKPGGGAWALADINNARVFVEAV